jgi:Uma2 family endonuclease
MSEAERQAVLDALPPDMPLDLHPPEGDAHRKAKQRPVDALEAFFRKLGRRVYVSSELVTYYPGEARFCPDLLAVLDVDPHERDSWNVSREQRGLDLVLEVHWKGHAEKDFETNVERYARLGITEYFVYDRSRYRLLGHRLPDAGSRTYQRLVPQAGRFESQVLGLDLRLEGERLRFSYGTADLADADQLIERLDGMLAALEAKHLTQQERLAEAERRADDEKRRADDEKRRADELERRADELERKVAELIESTRRTPT